MIKVAGCKCIELLCYPSLKHYMDALNIPLNPFNTFGSAALPVGTHLNYHWEQCAPINTTLTYEYLVIQNGFVTQQLK